VKVGKQHLFSRFRLDPANEQLWCGDTEVHLRCKTFEVLRYLVENPAQLVTKGALLDAVWPQIAVSDSMPAICVRELRKTLGDNAKPRRFIETVHSRGYRFIAQVTSKAASDSALKTTSVPVGPAPIMVGRDSELEQLRGWFAQVQEAQLRIAFVTGEPGIGKTTFVRAFLDSIGQQHAVRIGCGQCIEQYGAGEPYMPVLEALTRLGHEPDSDRILEALHRFAPTWLAQMPSLSKAERGKLPASTQPVTQQRMLREMALALESLTADSPLVLLFEDLQWSDFSTLGLISAIARRPEPARLFIIGTYRPAEMLMGTHPLRTVKEELEVHQLCDELRLQLWGPGNVADYLRSRFSSEPGEWWLATLAQGIHERTEGNPLFVVNLVDNLVAQGVLDPSGMGQRTEVVPLLDPSHGEMPRSILEMIERNVDQVASYEQLVLEVASVAGAEFSSAAVAAALEQPLREIESCCKRLSRHERFVQADGVTQWPDRTVAEGFHFRHALYRDVLYDRVPASHRIELHRRIAEREESAYGEQAGKIATELAHHYSRANHANKAIQYLQLAGERACARSAVIEAERHYSAAFELLRKRLPESPERDIRELQLRRSALSMLGALKGYVGRETIQAIEQAIALAEKSGNVRQLVNWLTSRGSTLLISGELLAADATLEQAHELAQRHGVQEVGQVHHVQILTRYWRGDLIGCERHFAAWLASFGDPLVCQSRSINVAVNSLAFASFNAWVLGRADVARERQVQMIAVANRGSPFEVANAGYCASRLELYLREYERARALCAHALELAEKHQLPDAAERSRCGIGAALAYLGRPTEGLGLIRQVLDGWLENGQRHAISIWMTYLAEAQELAGAVEDALETFQQALKVHPDELVTRPETIRLYAELRLKKGQTDMAEAGFRDAIALASDIGAKAWELRATMSLARLLASQSRRDDARAMLAKIYGWFTEGFDTADLKDAKALLEELNQQPIAPGHLNGHPPHRGPRHMRIQ
jgi:DNA-binding winged helix-turn-helix (wHTH) protein/tetratricopeptide (TPR) repeat protein